jgi:hypothetical protein
MLAVRERYKHLVELQLVAFPQGGLLVSPGTLDLMKAALDLGVDVVGGIDPAGIDRDPIRHLDTVFELATRYRRGVDIHLHDLGELGRWEIERICDMTQDLGLQGQVVISHAYALGAFPLGRAACTGRPAGSAEHLHHDLRAGALHGAAGGHAARARRDGVLGLGRHPRRLEPDG